MRFSGTALASRLGADETLDFFRENGQLPGETQFRAYPLCFAREINIQQEAEELPKDITGRAVRVLGIINLDRECDGYTE